LKNLRLNIKSDNVSNSAEIEKIIEGCKNNDRVSQQKLYKLLYSNMMGTCLRYTNDMDEAKDILQDGFMKVFMNIGKYTSDGSFEGWARRIFANLSIDYYRKRKNNNVYTNSDYIENIDAGQDDESENSKYNFKPELVMNHIQALTPAYKAVFNLNVMEGYTHKEIAQILGISEGTSKSNLAKAKATLKKKLTNNG
jgi:RNA polymerase sigma factor (sigma-70 family)